MLQFCCSNDDTDPELKHVSPPLVGGGLSHCLCRNWLPDPHILSQSDQESQTPQPPSTVDDKRDYRLERDTSLLLWDASICYKADYIMYDIYIKIILGIKRCIIVSYYRVQSNHNNWIYLKYYFTNCNTWSVTIGDHVLHKHNCQNYSESPE
jgi:hypothetical protein